MYNLSKLEPKLENLEINVYILLNITFILKN